MSQARLQSKRWELCETHADKTWRWVVEYENYVQVSSCGDVMLHARPRSHGRLESFDPPRLLHQRTWDGYWAVDMGAWCPLWKQRFDRWVKPTKMVTLKVHLMVLRAFLGEPPFADMEAGHLDGNPRNPHLENLYWVTKLENQFHRHGHGTCRCGTQPCIHRPGQPAAAYSHHERIGAICEAIRNSESPDAVAAQLGYYPSAVRYICRTKKQKALRNH